MRVKTLKDFIIIQEMVESRGVNQNALQLAKEICNDLFHSNDKEYILNVFSKSVKLIVKYDDTDGAELIFDEFPILMIGKNIDAGRMLSIVSHELNHLVEIIGKQRTDQIPKSEEKYNQTMYAYDMVKDQDAIKFMNLMYHSERTEINAMVQETYSDIFKSDNPQNALKNTRAYLMSIEMINVIKPEDYVIQIIKSIYARQKVKFDIDKSISRIKKCGKELQTKLNRLPDLISKEQKSFESFSNGILWESVLYKEVGVEKELLGITHTDPILGFFKGYRRGRTK